jgi:hypothetical protein
MVAKVGYSVPGRSGGRVTLCVFCTLHEETRSVGFLVGPQNHWDGFLYFGLKTSGSGFTIWASKPAAMVW